VSVATSRVEELGLQCVCSWCGMTTPLGVTCQSCGSPMDAIQRCRYCKKMATESVCAGCQDVLVRLWRVAQDSPECRFLFADVL
jgi:hypothetical protein